MKISLILTALIIAGCGPSCEERGGKYEFIGFIPVLVGKVQVLNPIYECVVPK